MIQAIGRIRPHRRTFDSSFQIFLPNDKFLIGIQNQRRGQDLERYRLLSTNSLITEKQEQFNKMLSSQSVYDWCCKDLDCRYHSLHDRMNFTILDKPCNICDTCCSKVNINLNNDICFENYSLEEPTKVVKNPYTTPKKCNNKEASIFSNIVTNPYNTRPKECKEASNFSNIITPYNSNQKHINHKNHDNIKKRKISAGTITQTPVNRYIDRYEETKTRKAFISRFLQDLQLKCFICGESKCHGNRCYKTKFSGGCYTCGDRSHSYYQCGDTKQSIQDILKNKACYSCFFPFKLNGNKYFHETKQCTWMKHLKMIMIDHVHYRVKKHKLSDSRKRMVSFLKHTYEDESSFNSFLYTKAIEYTQSPSKTKQRY